MSTQENLNASGITKAELETTDNAIVLAAGAYLVSQLGMSLINTIIGTVPERNGDILNTDTVEELALAEFQRRIIAKGGSQ